MRVSISGFFLYPLKDGDHKYIERLPSFLIVDVLLDLSDIERFAQGYADRKCRMIAAGA
jgi:hypothetical protein